MAADELMYNAAGVTIGAGAYMISLAWVVLTLVGYWKVFVKAGKPGWGAIVPFYNFYCLFQMAFGNGWLFLLLFVPCVGVVLQIIFCFKMAKAFDQGFGFGFGLLFLYPIFMMILGFGNSRYIGPQ